MSGRTTCIAAATATAAAAVVMPPGLGSPVSALHLLHLNKDTLLLGVDRLSSSCNCHSSSSAAAAAAAYLWDLRRPQRPAASLDIPAAAAATLSGAAEHKGSSVEGHDANKHSGCGLPILTGCDAGGVGGSSSPGGGALSLTVHEQGVLAAAGCRDGRCLVWDMRQVS
jgi:hypothetical protein